ncbi:putative ferredoxin--NADP(+) reductase [Gordonia hirsuta DSM 44140 = NBRC 16056]|uniref:ferredoxin--NADP(+) reductase n=1 Tax=Gordonia hirsuta DSM 44140 = NBRC 16056 TaxID=1121927 RepID=L7L5X7_9ACTN|nr:FAD-dependent oxidoreductase [Gordonia hirsuta]GAC56530.1 putative ferredoxin--NADP(+) reductase [Gordonia hirsuta DSM 44140 = NBRC 16056]
MAHVITRPCCNDASCVEVCPVNCIHPTPDEPEFLTAEMLYIDPETCIDCGACIDECPVDAIYPDDELDPRDEPYLQINADYYRDHDVEGGLGSPPKRPQLPEGAQLRVAVIGAGPAAFYAAGKLAEFSQISVDVFDRLPTPYGLVRGGVAPDHAKTKGVERTFAQTEKRANFTYHLNVDVGTHITHDELCERYGALLYAVGAPHDRRLGIPGEELPGSFAATDFVAWYNGHPGYTERTFPLDGERAVVVGTGNVALDVARILLADEATLGTTDIADHALAALRESSIREVVVLGRRGIEHAAFTNAEFLSLGDLPGIDVVVDPGELTLSPQAQAALDDGSLDSTVATKIRLAREFAARPAGSAGKRIVFHFLAAPQEVVGDTAVTAVICRRNSYRPDGTTAATDESFPLTTSALVRSVGYRGQSVPGLPFDDERAVVPNEQARVTDGAGGPVLPGLFVAGWIRRGPTGGIGRNRLCGEQAAAAILADFADGVLPEPVADPADVSELVAARGAQRVDLSGWGRIDAAEREAGEAGGRRRVKLVTVEQLVATAQAGN